MPTRIVTTLTEEQEAKLPIYRDKWRSLELLTASIDREKATAAIEAAYLASNYPQPDLLFFSSPMATIKNFLAVENFKTYLGRNIHTKFSKRVVNHIQYGIKQQIDDRLLIKLGNKIQFPEFPHYPTDNYPQASYFPYGVSRCTAHQLIVDLENFEFEFADILYFRDSLILPVEWATWGYMFDFCISVLNLNHDKKNGTYFKI
jgi:hypothetical protein